MISKDEFYAMVATYPNLVAKLWNKVESCVLATLTAKDAMITFGSLPSGDFLFLSEPTFSLLSDFELTVIKGRRSLLDGQKISSIVSAFNEKHAHHHLGFHLNAKVDSIDEFNTVMMTYPYYSATVATTGVHLAGPALPALETRPPAIDANTAYHVLKNIITQTIINLEQYGGTVDRKNDDVVSINLARSTLKMASLLSARECTFPRSYSAALGMLDDICPFHVIKALRDAMSSLDNPVASERSLSTFSLVWEYTVDRCGIESLSDCIPDLEDWMEILLKVFSTRALNSAGRRRLISFLTKKKEHWDYYRMLYGIESI